MRHPHRALGLLLSGVALAACGHGVAATQTSSNAGSTKQNDALQFARCMRAHGVGDFPDPSSGGAISISGGPNSDLSPDNPTFQHAQQACRSLLPNGGQPTAQQQEQMQQRALAFSQCMRAPGVTDFPDPRFQSGNEGFGIRLGGDGKGGDLNPNDPTFQHAQQACQSNLGMVGGPGGGGSRTTSGGGGGQGLVMQVGG